MCLRLFLNGDVKARDSHMSLYLVLMRDRINDVNLQWPFKFKVKFTLINHLLSNNNQSVSFWPDIKSNCFQCPTSDMNIPYGKSKCFSLDVFKKYRDQYVRNNYIFIRVEIDFSTERPVSVPINEAGELPNEEEYTDSMYDNLPHLLCFSDTT